jgi:hypothetical protein
MGIANLNDAFVTLQRAEEQCRLFHDEVAAFGRQYANALPIDFGHQEGWHVVFAGPLPAIPEHVVLMARDCLGSAQTVLNLAVHQFLLREDKEPQQANCFPLCETREDFLNTVKTPAQRGKRSPLRGLPINGDVWTIIEQSQPFNDSQPHDCPLALLKEFTQVDEQRTAPVVQTFLDRAKLVKSIHWRSHLQPIERDFRHVPLSPVHPTVVARFRFPITDEDPCVDVERDLKAETGIANGKTSVQTEFLYILLGHVRQTLEQFKALPRVQA